VKFYAITERGQRQLHDAESDWQRATGIVSKFVKLSKSVP
jgi:DNA-binding PadR family transcriptional regulator